jgi:Flp pilus assembly protein TadD
MASASFQTFQALMRRKAFAEAAQFAERQLLDKNEQSGFWLTQQSRAHLFANQPRKALDTAQRALLAAPANLYPLQARADAYCRLRSYTEAINDYQELLTDAKLAGRGQEGILECLAGRADWSALLDRLSVWQMPPENALLWRIKALSAQDQSEAAIAACKELLQLKPDHPRALWQLTELEIKRDGLESVVKRMARLAKIPNSPSVYAEIFASLSRRAGNTNAAINQYEKLTQGESNPRMMRQQAFALAKSGEELRAVGLMEELLRVDPRDMYIHKSYVAACKRLKDLDRAWNFYQQLLTLHPDEKTLFGRIRTLGKNLEHP